MVRPMYSHVGIWGYTPQLVPKRLVFDEQRPLQLIWVVQCASELLDTKSELLKQMFEQFNRSLNPNLLEAEVC
jgi:hypothetical protein